MKCLDCQTREPVCLFECSKGHRFDVDPSDYTNTIVVRDSTGRMVQVEKCPVCGEEGTTERYERSTLRRGDDLRSSDPAKGDGIN